MRGRRLTTLAGCLVAALLGACTPEPARVPVEPGTASPKPAGEIGIQGCPPVRRLVPGDTTDTCGLRIMEAVTARLVRLDPATGAPVNDLATSIETTDQRTFTVHLAPGRRFHDGTEVVAESFVRAWSWAAYAPNKASGARFFDAIEGAAAMRCTEGCPGQRPTRLAGLEVVDDHTFTIRTTRPVADLPARLAHPVFAPLPASFFAEGGEQAYAAKPVGAGPFRFASASPTQVVLDRADEYAGPAPARVRRVTVWMYDDPSHGVGPQRAYDDVVANRLDFTAVIPTDMLLDDQWKTDLRDRSAQADTQTPVVLAFLATDKQLADNPRLRRSIGRAIDRQTLARRIFQDTRTPATSWVPPAVPGYSGGACADLCTFDLDGAKQLYAAAGGYTGELDVTVDGDGGHKEWADSLCNQLKTNLGVDCQVNVLPDEKAVLEAIEAGRLTGLVRLDPVADHVSPGAYLAPFRSDSPADVSGFRDPHFDELLDRAAAAGDRAQALGLYRQAEARLAADPPSIPLWYASTPVGWSTRVTDVRLTPFGTLDLSQVRVR